VRFYVWIIRGTPLLVQLFLIFYGLPSIGITLDPFPAALIGFTLNVGAYSSEIVRAAVSSVPKGQWEASYSIGMTGRQALSRAADPLYRSGSHLPRLEFRSVHFASPDRTATGTVRRLPESRAMIELDGVHKRFGKLHALDGVSLGFAEGSVSALIGPSGGGKSTLLRCMNLLELPDSGRVRIGQAVIEFRPREKPPRTEVLKLRRQTGMVFQNFQLFPHRTALGNVMEGLVTVLGWPTKRARARSLELMKKVGLAQKADAWPSELSGGQQQRVAIARALAPAPRVLLCDEPTSALDPELSQEVVDVLAQLAREGTTMVMATHDLRLASRIAQTVVLIEGGRVVETGSADRIFTDPKEPRTRQFIATLLGAADPKVPR
jgi:cystine transport system ATP-binding protein